MSLCLRILFPAGFEIRFPEETVCLHRDASLVSPYSFPLFLHSLTGTSLESDFLIVQATAKGRAYVLEPQRISDDHK